MSDLETITCLKLKCEILGRIHFFYAPHDISIKQVGLALKAIYDTAHLADLMMVKVSKKEYNRCKLPSGAESREVSDITID